MERLSPLKINSRLSELIPKATPNAQLNHPILDLPTLFRRISDRSITTGKENSATTM